MSYISRHKNALIYLGLGQIGWFACVLSAASGRSYLGVGFVTILVTWHIARVPRSLTELKLIASVSFIGAAWETVLVVTGLLKYPHESSTLHHAPYWIIALWSLFAAQLNAAYGWLKSRLRVAAILGAIAGPASFRAGVSLHAVQIDDVWQTLPALAAGWSCLLPIAVMLSRRWNGTGFL